MNSQAQAPTLQDFIAIALQAPQLQVIESLVAGIGHLNCSPTDAVTEAIKLLLDKPLFEQAAFVPALRAIAVALGLNDRQIVKAALTNLFHRDEHARSSLKPTIFKLAEVCEIDDYTVRQIAAEIAAEYQSHQSTRPPRAESETAIVVPPFKHFAEPSESEAESTTDQSTELNRQIFSRTTAAETVISTRRESRGKQLGDAIAKFFNSPEINLSVEFLENAIGEGPRDWVLRLKPTLGVSVKKIRSFKEDLVVHAGLPMYGVVVQAMSEDGYGWVEFLIPKSPAEWRICYFADYQNQLVGDYTPGDELELPTGLNYQNHLKKSKLKTALIGGGSGGGKTCEVKQIVSGMCLRYPPSAYQFCGIDPQSVMLKKFLGYVWIAHPLLIGDDAKDPDKVKAFFEWIDKQAAEREELLGEVNAETIHDYNRIAENTDRPCLPFIHVIIEEIWLLETFIGVDAAIEQMVKIGGTYRKWGIFGLFVTQRPEQSVVPKLVRDNCAIRIATFVRSESSSQVILGDADGCEAAAYLQGAGHLAVVDETTSLPERLQGLYITDENIAEILEYGKSEYPTYVSLSPIASKHKPSSLNLSTPAAPNLSRTEIVQFDLIDEDLNADHWRNPDDDPDRELYETLVALEPRVRDRPDKSRGEIYQSDLIRQVFGLSDRFEISGGTKKSYLRRIEELKQKYSHAS